MQPIRAFTGRVLAALLAAAPLAAGCASLTAGLASAQQVESQKIVVHLGSFTDDLHSAFMAFSLATNMQKAGARVTVFLDREGVRLADQRERGDLTWGDSGPISKAMSDFVDAGGKVVVCPHCGELAGMTAANLRPGANWASHHDVAALMIEADKVIDF